MGLGQVGDLSNLNIAGLAFGTFGDVTNVKSAKAAYERSEQQGDNGAVSLAKGVGDFVWSEMFYGGMGMALGKVVGKLGITGLPAIGATMGLQLGISAGVGAFELVGGKLEHNARTMNQYYRQAGKFGSGYFAMSQAGYTMRQRSLNAIRQNGLNTQSVLGNEARTYYRASLMDE